MKTENPAENPAMTESETVSPRAARWKWALRLILGLLVLAILASRRQTLAEITGALRGVSLGVLTGSVAFYSAGQVLSAWKWQLLLRARGVEISLGESCRLYWAGMFGNLWLPTNIGGDGLRAFLLAPRAGLAAGAASIAVERLTGFAALIFIALCALLWSGAQNGQSGAILAGALALCAALVALIFASRTLAHRFAHHPIARKAESLSQALLFYWAPQNRAVLSVSLLISLIFQASQVVLNIFLAQATGMGLPSLVFWWLSPLLSLSGLVPIGIGGLGVREAAAVTLLSGENFRVASGAVVAWSLLWQSTVWLSSLLGVVWVQKKLKPGSRL